MADMLCRHQHETQEDANACRVQQKQILAIAESARKVGEAQGIAREAGAVAASEYLRRKGPCEYDPRGCTLTFSYERAVREAFESGFYQGAEHSRASRRG